MAHYLFSHRKSVDKSIRTWRHSRSLLYGAKYDVHEISPYDDVDVEQQQYLRMRVFMCQLVYQQQVGIFMYARVYVPTGVPTASW